jgi:tetratricopeptide (TPR) repeat protein
MSATDNGIAAGRNFNAAVAAFHRGDFAASASHYRAGLAFAPDCAPAYLDLAKAYEHLGDWDAALDALAVAFRFVPDHPTGIRRRERILEEKVTFDALAERLDDDVCLAFRNRFTLTVADGVDRASKEVAARALSQAYWEIGKVLETFPTEPVVAHLLPGTAGVRRGYPVWAAGIALENGTILAFLRQPKPHPGLLTALLRHEYCHLLVRELSGGGCPAWLDEAIAERFAKPRMAWEEARLNRAVASGNWIPLAELALPFTNLPPEDVALAYTECGRIGDYLAGTFGVESFRLLLRELRAGRPVEEAIPVVYEMEVDELESRLFGLSASEVLHAATA